MSDMFLEDVEVDAVPEETESKKVEHLIEKSKKAGLSEERCVFAGIALQCRA